MTEQFKPSPGYDNCPKCFGWQVRDLTPRDAKGWPTGPADIRDCDHCGGKGEVPKPKADPWACVDRYDPKPSEVEIDNDVPGWPLVNAGEGSIKLANAGWPTGTPTHVTEPPAASGWPSMNKEPGK